MMVQPVLWTRLRAREPVVRIRSAMEGGFAYFPGLAEPAEISTEDLAPAEAEDLARKVREAWPFGLPPDAVTEDLPGTRRYTVMVEEATGTEGTLVFQEPAADPSVSDLLAELRQYWKICRLRKRLRFLEGTSIPRFMARRPRSCRGLLATQHPR